MDEKTVARAILAAGYYLVNHRPPNKIVELVGGSRNDAVQYYSGSSDGDGFSFRDSLGKTIDLKKEGEKTWEVYYDRSFVARLSGDGSSIQAYDTYNSRNYGYVSPNSSPVNLGDYFFEVS